MPIAQNVRKKLKESFPDVMLRPITMDIMNRSAEEVPAHPAVAAIAAAAAIS
jgi:hypothetical protein